MAEEYGDDFVSIFVYVREAHPGENYPAHRSMEQKLSHARAFREQFDIKRPILVDDLAGTGHKLYGALPNMVYLIRKGGQGQVLFRSAWTDPATIRLIMDYMLTSRARRRAGERLTPFYAEFVGYRESDREKFMEVLTRAGKQAIDDLERARRRGPRPGEIVLDE